MDETQRSALLGVLQSRFDAHAHRHRGLDWGKVHARLIASTAKLRSVYEMECTGGEPDVVGQDDVTGEYIFVDCSAESPSGRRSLCYDRAALEARKSHKPKNSAIDLARSMGVELLHEDEYRRLQELEDFDRKTSSWIATPDSIRSQGGALFCDRRYGCVFVYHNGAESYYAARGFRASLRL